MRPVTLQPNLIDHFYAGGAKIAALRGIETTSTHQPEEWVAATVSRDGDPRIGLARTTEGDLLRDLVAADPRGWTGADAAPGGDTGILVKLLDAGQRLPVHVHPDRAFASRHLDCPYGKTEAWVVLDATGDGAVYLGWSQDVDPDEVARRRDAQDSDWLLGHLNRIEVTTGDGILVPAGTPHAIGEGVFVAEVQEPTDFSILLEWSITTSTRDESHLGLGFDRAMRALSYAALTPDRVAELQVHTDLAGVGGLHSLLPRAADEFFGVDLMVGGAAEVPAGFAAVVVLDGEGSIHGADAEGRVRAGEVLAVPAGLGPWTLTGETRALVCRPGGPPLLR